MLISLPVADAADTKETPGLSDKDLESLLASLKKKSGEQKDMDGMLRKAGLDPRKMKKNDNKESDMYDRLKKEYDRRQWVKKEEARKAQEAEEAEDSDDDDEDEG